MCDALNSCAYKRTRSSIRSGKRQKCQAIGRAGCNLQWHARRQSLAPAVSTHGISSSFTPFCTHSRYAETRSDMTFVCDLRCRPRWRCSLTFFVSHLSRLRCARRACGGGGGHMIRVISPFSDDRIMPYPDVAVLHGAATVAQQRRRSEFILRGLCS
jgi:hypothetical protein